VRNILTARYDVARGSRDAAAAIAQADTVGATAAANTAPPTGASTAPDTAGLATAFAAAIPERKADDTQVFHGLFADDHRTVPLAPLVSALWTSPNVTTPGGAPAQRSPSSRMLDLFKDLPSSPSS
jgi:hypothetical protein